MPFRIVRLIGVLITAAAAALALAAQNEPVSASSPLMLEKQGSFFVGGRDVQQAELWKQTVPDWKGSLPEPNPTVPALSELAQKLGGTVLVSHSHGGVYMFQVAVLSTKGVAGMILPRSPT